MTNWRALLAGAFVFAFIISAIAALPLSADPAQAKDKLEAIEVDIRQASKLEDKDKRDEAFKKIEGQLKPIEREYRDGPVANHALFVRALFNHKRNPDPADGQKYNAANQYRKLISRAGPGALKGNPPGGTWPDPIMERAYNSYVELRDVADGYNQKKTVYKFVDTLVRITGGNSSYSYWVAILLITLVVKLLTTPFSHLQFESMRNMQRIQPLIEKLKKEIGDDAKEFQRQQFQLMKDHNAMPLWGCLALLVQMPFLILIFHMIRSYEFQFAKGDFLWIGSPLTEAIPLIGSSLADPDWPLLILYGFSLFISTRMTAMGTADPAQQQQQKMMSILMPVLFVAIFNYFPSAFILYWLTFNILTTTQQYLMMKKPVPALAMEDDTDNADMRRTSELAPPPRKR